MPFSRLKKWSLFLVLAGALGFNLSMNPEHFNHIARIEKYPLQSMDWAQTAPESDKKDEAKVKVEKTEKEQVVSSREYHLGGKRGSFKAQVYNLGDSAVVRFENMDKSEGKTCELCGKSFDLSSKFKDIDDISRELIAYVNDKPLVKTEDKKDIADADEKPVQKKGEATEVDLDEWAAKCDKVSDSGKLACHKNRLIELSKYLKNSSTEAHYVTEYFNQYLKADIMTGFTSPTVKSNIFSNGFGMMQPTLEADSSLLEQSNEFSEALISGLRGKNGKPTVELLIKMRAASFTAQIRNSQRLLVEGLNEGNGYKFQIGFQGMQPDYQKLLLQQSTQSMLSAVDSMQATPTEKSYFQNYVGNSLFSPVDTVLAQLKNFVLGKDANGATITGNHNFADFQVPSLGESMILLPNQVVNTNLQALLRAGSQSRGESIRTQWGIGDPGALSTNRNLLNSTSIPAGRTARGAQF